MRTSCCAFCRYAKAGRAAAGYTKGRQLHGQNGLPLPKYDQAYMSDVLRCLSTTGSHPHPPPPNDPILEQVWRNNVMPCFPLGTIFADRSHHSAAFDEHAKLMATNAWNHIKENLEPRLRQPDGAQHMLCYGVDPGRTDLIKAISSLQARTGIVSLSNKEWQHISGQQRRRLKRDLWVNKHPVKAIQDAVPSAAVSTTTALQAHITHHLTRLAQLADFWTARRVTRQRLGAYIQAQKAMDAVGVRFAGKQPRRQEDVQCIIGFGAGSFSSTSRGHAPGRKEAWKQFLSRYAYVVLLDEFRSSMVCSACDGILKNVYDRTGRLIYRIKRCPDCGRFWHRDVNAPRNLLRILLAWIRGRRRPRALCPPERRQSAARNG
ncbi:hypothetical protein WJX72_009306 [[Myrmecia] bisecta]|uniref:Cas12f1-like TNB domain-containing protein n=1 Tax=[Myrmecia] bisecta TaxID=41462 RepID=A0AAW1PHT4_9CHLO